LTLALKCRKNGKNRTKNKKTTPKMPFWTFLMAKTGGRKNHYSPSDRDVKEAYGDLCEMCKTSRLVSKFLSSVIFVYNLLTHHGD
jgi:hypothetical protein